MATPNSDSSYNLRIGADATGAVQSLSSLRNEIKTLTSSWKAERAELKSTGDSFGAAKAKLSGLSDAITKQRSLIDAYKDKINGLKASQMGLDTSTKEGKAGFESYANQISKLQSRMESARTRLASMTSQQDRARNSVKMYQSGLIQVQQRLRLLTNATTAHANRLEAEGKSAEATKTRMSGLSVVIGQLDSKYQIQVRELNRIAATSGKASQAYQQQKIRVDQTATALAKAKTQLRTLSESTSSYQTHLKGLKGSYDQISKVSKSYVDRLKAEGKTEQANKHQMNAYKDSIENLSKQYSLQERELSRIASEAGKSSEAYKKQRVAVNETATALAKTKTQMNGLAESMRKANPSIFDRIKSKLTGVNGEAKQGHSLFKQMFSADVISNAFTNGLSTVWNGFKGMVTSGMQLDEAVERINDQFKALGKSRSEIKGLDTEVTFLKTHTHATGAEAAQLLQTTNRMASGNTKQAMQLARGIGAIGDGAKASGRQMNTLAMGMSRVVASGKVSAGTFNRMAKAAPNLGHALAQAAGVSEQKFNEMVQSGKMSSADFMRYVERAGQNGSKTFRDFTKTQQGATWYMTQSWAALKAKLTQPLFNAKTSGLTQLADLMNSKPVQQGTQMLAEGLRQVAKYALEGLGWMAKHKKDIVGIGSDFVVIVKDLAIDVWKDFAAILTDLAKDFGLVSRNASASKDPLHDFRRTMDAIAKNPGAVKKIANALVVIAGLKSLGAVVSPIARIATFRVPENSVIAKLFKMSKNSNMFKGLENSAKSAATSMSGHFSKVWDGLTSSAKTVAGKLPGMFTGAWQKVRQGLTDALSGKSAGGMFQSMKSAGGPGGLSAGGKAMSGLAVAGVGLDVASQISHAIKDAPGSKKRYQDAGKGVGSAIGGGIGLWFGGPAGAAVGSQIGKIIGGWGGKEVHAFMQGWNSHMPPANKWSLPNLGYSSHQMWSRMSSGFAKGATGFHKTMDTYGKNIKRWWKNLWNGVDLAQFWKKIKKEWSDGWNRLFGSGRKSESQLEKQYSGHIKRQERATSRHVKASTKATANMYGTEEKSQSRHYKKSESAHSRHIKASEKASAAHRKRHSKNRSNDYKKSEREQSSHYKRSERAKKNHVKKIEKSDVSHRKKHSKNKSNSYKALEKAEAGHYKKSEASRVSYAKKMAAISKRYDKNTPKQWKRQWNEIDKAFRSGEKRVEKTYQSFFRRFNSITKKSIKGAGKSWKSFWRANVNVVKRWAADVHKQYNKGIKYLEKSFKSFTTRAQKNWNRHWNNLNKSVAAFWRKAEKTDQAGANRLVKTIQDFARRAEKEWDNYHKEVLDGEEEFNKEMSNHRETFLTSLLHSTISQLQAIEKAWRNYWTSVEKTDTAGWKTLLKHEDTWSRTMMKRLSTFSRSYQKGFKNLGTAVDRIWQQAFTKLRHTTVNGLNGMIAELNRGIDRINGVISAYGGHSRIGHAGRVSYATGTGASGMTRRPVTKPTMAILNDGHDSPDTGNKESVIHPNGAFEVIQGTNVPHLLEPGAEVLNATQTKDLMHGFGIEHYATGTGLLGIGAWSKSSDEGLKKYYDKAEDIIKNATKYFGQLFTYSGGRLSGAIGSIASGMFNQAKTQASDFWSTLWSMASEELDGGDASGLLGAVEKYGHGKPYVWGAAGANAFDCSGLVMYALQKAFHISFPHYSGAQYALTKPVSNPQPGDLVFFGPGGSEHVGVYAGGGKYYSARSPQLGIGMSPVGSGAIFRRIPGLRPANGSSSGPKADSAIKKYVKAAVGSGFWKFMEKLGDKFGFGAMDNPAGTGVARWVEVIKKAADEMHVSLSHGDISLIENVIQHESGGNPLASQNPGVWDVNMATGHPAQGLLQYVPSTFRNYEMPGHTNIHNGYDQLLALFNDATWRSDLHWGGGWTPNGRRRFANGGVATSPAIFGEAGPEMAIPLSAAKSSRSYELLGKTASMLAARDHVQASNEDTHLAKKLDDLMDAINVLVNSLTAETEVKTEISMDSRKVGQTVSKYVSRAMAARMRSRRLRVSG